MANGGLKFGVYVLQDAPLAELRRRWQEAESLGFDQLWVADHTQDFRRPAGIWFDGWAVLTAMALETRTIRIGALVANPILRPPAVLARLAATVDNFSGGRLEVGVGTGIAGFDHDATGTPYWPMNERLGRFRDYVTILDELLRHPEEAVNVDGDYLRTTALGLGALAVQRPRPPLILGGQSPAVVRLVAERADCWNTHGPFGASMEEIVDVTRTQNARLDDLCEASGRDPAQVRRSILLYEALDAYKSPDAFERVVSAFVHIGVTEFVMFWPSPEQRPVFEQAVAAMDRLRS